MQLQIEEYPYSDILGWSVSRYDIFSTCKRRYYYQYYGKYDPELSRRQIDSLKSLTSTALEIGHLTHEMIALLLNRLLRSTQPIDRDRFIGAIENYVSESLQSKRFFEIHYREKNTIPAEELIEPIREALDAFLSSDRFEWIREQASGNPQWLIEPTKYGEGRIDGFKVYCKVDFLFILDGKLVILDWKTGKQDAIKHSKQLLAYCTWSAHQWKLAASAMIAVVAYLRPSYAEAEMIPTESEIDGFADQIRFETDEMYRFTVDPDQNLPLPKENFAMTPHVGLCRYCNFKELCGRD